MTITQIRYYKNKLTDIHKKKEKYGVITTTPPAYSSTSSQEVNIRAIMAVYYQGAGPRDIGNATSFLGVPGGKTFYNLFYNNMD